MASFYGRIYGRNTTGHTALDSALHERDPYPGKNMFWRLWTILFNYMAIFHFTLVYLTLVAVVLVSYRCFFQESGTDRIILCLITHAFWPPLTFLFICSSLWTPVSYAIDPTATPDRKELLQRDSKTGVAHPAIKSKMIAFGGQAAWFELEHTTATLYTVLIFVLLFYFLKLMITGRYIHPGSSRVGSRDFMHHGPFIHGVPVHIALVGMRIV